MRLGCALAALALLTPRAWADGPALVQFTDVGDPQAGWKPHRTREGVTLERRAVPGSSYYEYRVIVEIAVDPVRAADEIWAALQGGDMDSLKRRQILRASGEELIVYDQIRAPVVSDRDYTLRVQRLYDPARRRTQFRCETANELGPPRARGHVRIPVIRAGWMTEPDGRGGTRLTQFAYSDPGGLLPAFLVRGAQADRSLADVLRMRQRLLARASTGH
jgi:hypothetical protein